MQNIENLNDLRYIAAIAESGSLSAAAKRLGVNHATVFRRVLHSEEQLGVRLFERSGGRYTVTPAGEELARAGALMEATAAEALRKITGRDLQLHGTVSITSTESIAHELLMPLVKQCRDLYPDIRLNIIIGDQLANLSKRDADIAIRPTRQPPDHLIGKKIGPLAFAVYGAQAYLQAAGELDWGEHQWIALDDTQSAHRSLKWLKQFQEPDDISLRITGFSRVAQACVDGFGLAVLPCFIGERQKDLQRVCAPIEELESELWLLTHPDLRETARIKAVFQVLQQGFASLGGLLAGVR